MSQTTYNDEQGASFAGQKADLGFDLVDSAFNEEAVTLPFGILVKKGTADNQIKLFTTGAKPAGVLLHTHSYNDGQGVVSASGGPCNVMRQGRCWVLVEEAVTKGGDVYARHTANGGDTQKGSFRQNADGIAQVTTVTPTAANTTLYSLDVFVDGKPYHFEMTSDASGTATEICDAFRTAMAADSAFTALIVATGTVTLILTSQVAGAVFQAASGGSPGVLAFAATTAASVKADLVLGAKYASSAAADVLALVEFNLPA